MVPIALAVIVMIASGSPRSASAQASDAGEWRPGSFIRDTSGTMYVGMDSKIDAIVPPPLPTYEWWEAWQGAEARAVFGAIWVTAALGMDIEGKARTPIGGGNWLGIAFRVQPRISSVLFASTGQAGVTFESRLGGSDAFLFLGGGINAVAIDVVSIDSNNSGDGSYSALQASLGFGARLSDEVYMQLGGMIWYQTSTSRTESGGTYFAVNDRANGFGNLLVGGLIIFDVRGEGLRIEAGGPLFVRILYSWHIFPR